MWKVSWLYEKVHNFLVVQLLVKGFHFEQAVTFFFFFFFSFGPTKPKSLDTPLLDTMH